MGEIVFCALHILAYLILINLIGVEICLFSLYEWETEDKGLVGGLSPVNVQLGFAP